MATVTPISTITTNFHRPKPPLQPNTKLLFKTQQTFTFKAKPYNNLHNHLSSSQTTLISSATRRTSTTADDVSLDDNLRKALQFLLWTAEGVYIVWLFLLPYAP
ncbi:hypothetical protein Tco_1536620, partial [Tanacetum coccineum]